MTTTIPMEEFLSLIGHSGVTQQIIQASKKWVDGQNAKEAIFDVQILQGHTNLTLSLETAVAGEGPWREVEAFDTNTVQQTPVYATSREGGTTQFERLLRWKLDPSNTNLTSLQQWVTCFKICVTLK